ncbi:hypothetical protein U9M48_002597 [Paspalum notatum var. saurae]|uniref:DCD domain-containing protein n=1 Tax=Paspalum notatum var. saurae TaxID=547442 RepID=A0AAQ3SG85_PASNO
MANHCSPPPPPPASASPSPPASKRTHSQAAAAEEEDPHPGASSPAATSPAGFIFMCNGATKPDCYRHRVLGLPRGKLEDVSRIRRGAAVFLYDFDAKHLYGPYLADSDGGLGLVPGAFHGRFPAQVKFKIDGDFMPLPESSLRSAIKENYTKGKFSPELSSTQVEKLKALFQPIALLPESSPPLDVDNWPPAPAPLPPSTYLAQPSAYAHHPTASVAPIALHPESSPLHDVDNWPPAPAPLPPSTYQAQPSAYAHHQTASVAPQAAHSVPPESYAPPYSYLPPTAQLTTNITMTRYGYQGGYEPRSLPSTYHYVQAPPSCSLYAQSSMPSHVSDPAYSAVSYYTAYQYHPYQLANGDSQYQQRVYERATYGAEHDMVTTSLQLVRQYGSTPSSLTAGPLRDWGLLNQLQQVVTGFTHASGSGSQGAGPMGDYYA